MRAPRVNKLLAPMKRVGETILKHLDGILGYWDSDRLTNAFMEGLMSVFSFCSGKDTHQAFHEGIGKAVAVPVSEDSVKMLQDGFPDALHRRKQLVNPRRTHGPRGPFLKVPSG